ncbi:MAG TPA: DUF2520 domain-containing protein [Polyangia bacterium]|nr:DUF2520 domain-containing protein [Polyangia bacterium]
MITNEMSEIEVNARASAEGPAEPTPVVFIVGAGVVGTALAARLVRAGVPVAGLHGRKHDLSDAAGAVSGVLASTGEIPPILSESDVVIISVRDERIPEVAARLVREKRLRKEQVVLHTSGAIAAAQALAVARPHVRAVGTLHPLVSFADARVAVEELKSVAFGIEGDEPARAVATRLVRSLGARAVFLDAENLPLYHVGAVIAANYVVALADMARRLLVKAGVPEDQALPALIPLLSSVVQNLSQVGLPGALTGPVERGDVSSVEQHLRILEARAPEMLDLYRLIGRDVLRLAQEKSALEPATVGRLESLFRARGATGGTSGGTVNQSAEEPTKVPTRAASQQSTRESMKESMKESTKESMKDPSKDAGREGAKKKR